MNGNRKSRKLIQTGFRRIIYIIMISAVVWGMGTVGAAVSVNGMEYGGFDVDVGGGESWEYPPDWENSQGNISQGDGAQGNPFQEGTIQGDGTQGNSFQENTIQGGGAQGSPSQWDFSQWDSGQSNSEGYYNYWQGNVYGDFGGNPQGGSYIPYGNDTNPYMQTEPYIQPDGQPGQSVYGAQGQAWSWQPDGQQNAGDNQNTGQDRTGQEAGNEQLQVSPPVKVSPSAEVSPLPQATPTAMPTPTSSPTPSEKKKSGLTLTPAPVKNRKPEQTVTGEESGEGSESFTYYSKRKGKEKTENNIDDTISFYHERRPKEKTPEIHVKSEGAVQILSIHFNGEECSWHWEEDMLVLEKEVREKENRIEILVVSEKGGLARMEPWIF